MVTIFVEGISDKDFLELYIKYLKNNGDIKNEINYKIEQVGGKDKLFEYKNKIKKTNGKYVIVFDTDLDYNDSINNIKNQFEISDDDNIFLFPNNSDTGDLETLLEKIAIYRDVLNCFDNYEKCINGLKNNNPKINTPAKKSKVYSYMHAFGFKNTIRKIEKFDLAQYVNFDDDYLNDLKLFLIKFLK
ncbi:DUF3226 domain-containing protein [Brachyspira hyodysenteriae]|uniref:DUF3226 domain-containing protein n=1 Tax=Brachyspira hyodysenteriae TaxID=159 RepID=UPI00063D9B4D|nr:DUF3226 domain-containing protein [Brachyspira hyodysenteriae]KLI23697.1 hypothetical protein SU43_06185 [Brachyspira hyodysenteriae]TVL56708.1 hypothetical protein A9X86_04715 [Brachyspira hyodysenteriae]